MPKLSEDVPHILETIEKNLRHQDYQHVQDIAKEYTTFATGVGVSEMLKRFNGRESLEMFTQRVNLTIVNTMDIHNSCVKPLYKVVRTPATTHMAWSGKDSMQNAENKKKLELVADNFWGQQSVTKYLNKRIPDRDKCDPNAWFIVEWKEQARPDNEEKPNPYPFEANSKEAINFFFHNNILQWLIVRNEIQIITDNETFAPGEVLYSYLENHNIVATQIHYTVIENWKAANPTNILIDNTISLDDLSEGQIYLYQTGGKEAKSQRFYMVQIYQHNIGFVPAKRFGTITDPATDDRTLVPMIEPAKSYLQDSIQTMSEFSLTKRLHTFPQKFQYLPKCEGSEQHPCFKGQVAGGKICKICQGTGTIAHTSSQDMIGIRMPDDPKEMFDLEKIATYKGPPIDLVKFQKEFGFEDLKRYAENAVYGGGSSKTKIVKTATENEIDLDSKYDALKPFADHYSECEIFIYTILAKLRDMDAGFEYSHQFPSDFGLEPLDYLFELLSQANKSGAPSHIIKALNWKITKKIYIDQQREITKLEVQSKFDPFPGKTESEIAILMQSNFNSRFSKVLHANFGNVFAQLESEFVLKNIDFYELDIKVQSAAIKSVVSRILNEIDTDESNASAAAFGGMDGGGTPEQIEAETKAKLRGSIDGVNGILAIQASVGTGTTSYEAGLEMLMSIFAFTLEEAKRELGKPKPQPVKTTAPSLN